METWVKALIIAIIFGGASFALTPLLWTPTIDAKPIATQLPFFIGLSVIESIIFGVGIAFLVFGWPFVKDTTPQAKNMALAAYISIGWLLVSWWPHDNFHIQNGMNMQGLLYID